MAQLPAHSKGDDRSFNAALVSFGSFGIMCGVLIEVEPIYLLEVTRVRLPLDDRLKGLMETLDFSGADVVDAAREPFHFEVVVNPHDTGRGAYVTTMYDREYDGNHTPPPLSPAGLGPGDDVVALMGKLSDSLPALVGGLANLIVPAEYPLLDKVLGTPGEIFYSEATFQKALSAEIGVALEDAARVLELMLATPQVKDYAGLLAFRYVKGSKALLAFTKFDTTCTIELPAAYADSTAAFYDGVWERLEAAGIPYTMHWGQMNNFTAQRVRNMFGEAVDAWIQSRNTLMEAQSRAVFSSPFLRQCGLV